MADISISPNAIKKGANATIHVGFAATAMQAGYAIGRMTTGKFTQVFANSPQSGCNGIALCGCAIDQPFVYVESDSELDFGFSDIQAGKNIYVSETGLTFDVSDIEISGNRIMTIGNVNDDGSVTLQILNGATIP